MAYPSAVSMLLLK